MLYDLPIASRPGAAARRAAQYVRMSTEQQKYSTENQAEAIAAYAAERNLTIIRTYADEGSVASVSVGAAASNP